jgi:hypothetical protein
MNGFSSSELPSVVSDDRRVHNTWPQNVSFRQTPRPISSTKQVRRAESLGRMKRYRPSPLAPSECFTSPRDSSRSNAVLIPASPYPRRRAICGALARVAPWWYRNTMASHSLRSDTPKVASARGPEKYQSLQVPRFDHKSLWLIRQVRAFLSPTSPCDPGARRTVLAQLRQRRRSVFAEQLESIANQTDKHTISK